MGKFHMRNLSSLVLCLSILGSAHLQAADIVNRKKPFVGQFLERSFIIDRPEVTAASHSHPIVIVLHGAYGNAKGMRKILNANMRPLIDKHQFMVAYLNGNPIRKRPHIGTWNAGICCGRSSRDNLDDVGFISKFIEYATKKFSADAQRVYLIGYSNGAMMAYRYICEHPEKIVAITAVSGPVMTGQCSPGGLNGVLHIHGMADKRVPPNGGKSKHGLARPNNYTSVQKTEQIMTNAGVSFMFKPLPEVKHGLGQVNRKINVPATAWHFFQNAHESQTVMASEE